MIVLISLAAAVMTATPLAREVTVVLPGLSVSGIEDSVGNALLERFASELGRGKGLRVVTSRDVEQVLGLERQRQLMGCPEAATSCFAELAAGLGADALIIGSVVMVGTRVTVTLRVLSAKDGRVLHSESGRLRDLDAVQDWLDEQVPATRAKLLGTFAPASAQPPGNWLPWATAGLGGAGVVTGVVLFALSKGDAASLRAVEQGSTLDLAAVRAAGQTKETAGVVLMAAGAGVIAGGIVWGLVSGGRAPTTSVSVAVTPGGAALVISGALP